jgi:hypothetical protein
MNYQQEDKRLIIEVILTAQCIVNNYPFVNRVLHPF